MRDLSQAKAQTPQQVRGAFTAVGSFPVGNFVELRDEQGANLIV